MTKLPRQPSFLRPCERCGEPIRVFPSWDRKSPVKFCSRACFALAESHGHEDRVCETCGATFQRPLRASDAAVARRFCTIDCYHAFRHRVWEQPWEERFWSRVQKTDGCWLWTGSVRRGYGDFQMDWAQNKGSGVHRAAHHLAWELATAEPVPAGLMLGHTCDVSLCVKVDDAGIYTVGMKEFRRQGHLFLCTQADNMADMTSKGRHPHAILTPDLVRDIRRRHANGEVGPTTLAREFGLTRSAIRHMLSGRTWSHVV